MVTALVLSLSAYEVVRRISPLRFLFGMGQARVAVPKPRTATGKADPQERNPAGAGNQDTPAL